MSSVQASGAGPAAGADAPPQRSFLGKLSPSLETRVSSVLSDRFKCFGDLSALKKIKDTMDSVDMEHRVVNCSPHDRHHRSDHFFPDGL